MAVSSPSTYTTKEKLVNDSPQEVTGTDVSGSKRALDTYVAGGTVASIPSGLNIAGRITEVTLNSSTWTALPSTPLADRNALSIQNLSGIEIKVNYDSGVATYTGMVLSNGNERFYDITDNVIIYAKSASGTPTVVVEEIS